MDFFEIFFAFPVTSVILILTCNSLVLTIGFCDKIFFFFIIDRYNDFFFLIKFHFYVTIDQYINVMVCEYFFLTIDRHNGIKNFSV